MTQNKENIVKIKRNMRKPYILFARSRYNNGSKSYGNINIQGNMGYFKARMKMNR